MDAEMFGQIPSPDGWLILLLFVFDALSTVSVVSGQRESRVRFFKVQQVLCQKKDKRSRKKDMTDSGYQYHYAPVSDYKKKKKKNKIKARKKLKLNASNSNRLPDLKLNADFFADYALFKQPACRGCIHPQFKKNKYGPAFFVSFVCTPAFKYEVGQKLCCFSIWPTARNSAHSVSV